jgi:hypothetical protein
MNRLLTCVLIALTVLLGCTTAPKPLGYVPVEEINIPLRFAWKKIDEQTFKDEMKRCIPSQDDEAVARAAQGFPKPVNTVSAYLNYLDARGYVINGSSSTCISYSTSKFPIWAAEMIEATANPTEVPANVMNDWNTLIARRLATDGHVNVAYVLKNGNAYFVMYSVKRTTGSTHIKDATGKWVRHDAMAHVIQYPVEFKKAGEWLVDPDTLRLEHPSATGFKSFRRGGKYEKNVSERKD